jgi:hypothetical protein
VARSPTYDSDIKADCFLPGSTVHNSQAVEIEIKQKFKVNLKVKMSLLTWFHDPIWEMERPLRVFNQNFGTEFDDEDFFPWWTPTGRAPALYWLRSRQVPEQTTYEKQLQKSGVSELNVAKDNFTVSQLKQMGAQFK